MAAYTPSGMNEGQYDYDLFMSHASEDKDGLVRDLVAALEGRGLKVWFDEAELQVGDSLTQAIDDGLRRSRFGVVVLSEAFFAKRWPRAELDALATREISGDGGVVVLPIWLDVHEAQVQAYSPQLARKLALRSEEGVETITDKLEQRVRGRSSVVLEDARESEPAALDPSYLRGQMLPYSYSPIVSSDEHALVSRVALVAAVPTTPEPTLRPATQQVFEDALAGSLLESFMLELTEPLGRADPEDWWRLASPTTTRVITATRPAAKMQVSGWTAEARSAISLVPQASVAPLGWLTIHADIAIRPLVATPVVDEWIPLSLDDLFGLIYVPLGALLDEVAPAVLEAITGNALELMSVSCLLLPHGDVLSRYVRLDLDARGRVEGATDAHAVDWYPTSLAQIATPEARAVAIRDRIERLFVDGGFRGFETALERLTPPRLASPPPT